jgi:hypothetical protein
VDGEVDGRISPSNVEDPRFTEPDAGPEIGWTPPDFGVHWPDVINALLEALPVVLERLRW